MLRRISATPKVDWSAVADCASVIEFKHALPWLLSAIRNAESRKLDSASRAFATYQRLQSWSRVLMMMVECSSGMGIFIAYDALNWASAVAVGGSEQAAEIKGMLLRGVRSGSSGIGDVPYGRIDPIGAVVGECLMRCGDNSREWPSSGFVGRSAVAWASDAVVAQNTGDLGAVAWDSIVQSWLDLRFADVLSGKYASWHSSVPFSLLPIELYGFAKSIAPRGVVIEIPAHPFAAFLLHDGCSEEDRCESQELCDVIAETVVMLHHHLPA